MTRRKPNTVEPPAFEWEIGSPNLRQWRDFGPYMYCRTQFARNMPAVAELRIPRDHPKAEQILGCRHTVVPMRTAYNGKKWDGRVLSARCAGRPGEEIVTAILVSNWYWLLCILGFPTPLITTPEFQPIKHDISFGRVDHVLKYFITMNAARLQVPVYAAIQPDTVDPGIPMGLNDIDSIDDVIEFIEQSTEDHVALWSRMTVLSELFKQATETTDIEIEIHQWTTDEPDPGRIFNTDSPADLARIINWEGFEAFFNFLNIGNALGLADPNRWNTATDPCYIVTTRGKRDRPTLEWSTEGGQIEWIDRNVEHTTGWQVIVGGRAPEWANSLVEFIMNFLIQAGLTALGLGAFGGVGDFFNDRIMAYQRFENHELKAKPHDERQHLFAEGFADNTGAFSLDAFTAGKAKLQEIGGSDAVKITILAGGPDGRGYSFGADDGTGKRFDLGDIPRFYDRGTVIQDYISAVEVLDDRENRVTETVTIGDDKALRSAWESVIGKLGDAAGLFRAIANATN